MRACKCSCAKATISSQFCCWSVKLIGYIIGWFGVTYRTAALITVSIYLARYQHYHPNLHLVSLLVAVTYCALSIIANIILLVGIRRNSPWFFWPYLGFMFFEIMVLVVLLLVGCILLPMIELQVYLFALIPAGFAFVGLYIYMWLCLVGLLKTMGNGGKVYSVNS